MSQNSMEFYSKFLSHYMNSEQELINNWVEEAFFIQDSTVFCTLRTASFISRGGSSVSWLSAARCKGRI